MNTTIQVVEPTLESHSGHCHFLVSSFCRAAAGLQVRLWAGKGAERIDFGPGVTVHPYFSRRLRFFQSLFLFRRLLREPFPLFIPTARRADLTLLNLAAGKQIARNSVFLYFHWVRETPGKLDSLRKIAARQPNLVILGTTASVVEVFRRCGFAHVALLPYPPTQAQRPSAAMPFRRLLYAGAARQDKGFRQVVDYVEFLARQKEKIPITIQVSADHYGKYDPATREDITRLRSTGYAPLELAAETLSPEDYAALFRGGICLQLYDRADFRDRVSGVTLDALAHGSPIIATAGSWMANMIEPFGAGVAVEEPTPGNLHRAVTYIIGDYARFQEGAFRAGQAQQQQSWDVLLEMLGMGDE
jgi:glycosyltransferase involved in cell wall biosynthesis